MKKLFAFLFIICIVMSCSEKIDNANYPSVTNNSNLELKKKFAKALALSFDLNLELRELIKTEALKKIDYDYDVLYLLIKDEVISSKGETVEDLLSKFMSIDDLQAIKIQIPTLTVFVPSLSIDEFSAESWDIENQIPYVGIREIGMNYVIGYNSVGEDIIIKSTPEFPVVVVKENERVRPISSDSNLSSTISTRSGYKTNLEFVDDIFNNVDNLNSIGNNKEYQVGTRGREVPLDTIPSEINKACEAYNIYENNDGWQRDYIYYNITPDQVNGKFDGNYSECLLGFEMLGDPKKAFEKISDQAGDPQITTIHGVSSWTDGEFEFEIKVYLGNKSGFGNELVKYLRISPSQLFSLHRGDPEYIGTLNPANVSLPLFEWNLENYGAAVKIAVEEVDGTETVKTTSTTSTEFATNFGFDFSISPNEKVKLGLKFGVTDKETSSTAYEVSQTLGNDKLGEVIVNFSDKIFVDKPKFVRSGLTYRPKNLNTKYSTGWCRLYFGSKKVQ